MDKSVSTKIDEFFNRYTLRSLKAGEILAQAGETLPGIFYLESGRVRQYDISEHGTELVLNTFKPRAFFPVARALRKGANPYFFEAVAPITYRMAPAEEIIAFLQTNPDVMLDLLARVYRGTDGVLRRMAYMIGGGAHRRAVYELYVAAQRFGRKTENGIAISMHEGELARSAGLSRETLSRELQGLKKSGAVRITRKDIVLKDTAVLERELGFED
ncbi:MAG TPA: Crp/Fnr family transcriptional regulator [Candidatus Saccharimonadales bacterium]